jgi:hypothetical protein
MVFGFKLQMRFLQYRKKKNLCYLNQSKSLKEKFKNRFSTDVYKENWPESF